jgi:hypothetical protein
MATSYSNSGGTGDRRAIIDISTDMLPADSGDVEDLIDGSQANSYKWSEGYTSGYIQFDFGPGTAKIITEAKLYCSATSGIRHGKWTWQVSNTAAAGSWMSVSSSYQIGDNADPIIVMQLPNGWTDFGYRYYRFTLTQGFTDSDVYKREMEFKIDDAPDTVAIKDVSYTGYIESGGTSNYTADVVDNKGHAISYLWTTVDGGSFNNTTIQNPIWTAPVNNSGATVDYTIGLTVTCNGSPGDSDTDSFEQSVYTAIADDTVTITQLPAGDTNPVASASTVTCTVVASDNQGHTVSYLWQSLDGGSFNDATLQNPTWTAPANALGYTVNYTISVTATCNGSPGDVDIKSYEQGVLTASSDIVTITQLPAGGTNPVISLGTVNCTTLAVDSLGHAISYLWTTVDGGSFNNATLQNPIWTAPANVTGSTVNYTISVTATCDDGTPATDTKSYEQGVLTAATADTVTITQLPVGGTNPVASAGTVNCTTLAVDNLSHTVIYLWDTPDGGSFNDTTLREPIWTAPANTTNATVNYTIGVTATCNGTPAKTDYKTYEQSVLAIPITETSNSRNYSKLGGPHDTPTVITTNGWIGVETNTPGYSIDALGMIQAQESLWGSSKSILDGIQVVDLDDCNMVTCTLTQNTILTATGGHEGQLVGFVFTEDVTGSWTVTFGAGFNATSVKYGLANKLIGVIFAYDGSVWKELGGTDSIPGLINQTLRHDGEEWVANNILKIYPSGAQITEDHTDGTIPMIPDLVYVASGTLVDAGLVPDGTLGVVYLGAGPSGTTHYPVTVNEPLYIVGQDISLQYNAGDFTINPSGELELIPISGLPSGIVNNTIRHNGVTWEASETFNVYPSGVEATYDHASGVLPRVVNIVYVANPMSLVAASTVPVGTLGIIYVP